MRDINQIIMRLQIFNKRKLLEIHPSYILYAYYVHAHMRTMLLRLSKSLAAPMSGPPKQHYFWMIQHASINFFEESEQHSMRRLWHNEVDKGQTDFSKPTTLHSINTKGKGKQWRNSNSYHFQKKASHLKSLNASDLLSHYITDSWQNCSCYRLQL